MKTSKYALVKKLIFIAMLGATGTALAATEVQCRIESNNFLSSTDSDQYTPQYKLSAPATQPGGRHLLQHTEQYELWLKTDSYTRTNNTFRITGFSVALIDKKSQLMTEATSTSLSPMSAALTSHTLNKNMSIEGRLILSCQEINK